MEKFSVLDCEILWNKKNKIPKSHKTAIKETLKTMSASIQNAMKFTSDNEQSIVTYTFIPEIENQECEVSYFLEVYVAGYEEEQKFWHAAVRSRSKVWDWPTFTMKNFAYIQACLKKTLNPTASPNKAFHGLGSIDTS